MMETNPEQISLASLEVLVMPTGEIICLGETIGYVKDIGKFLSNVRVAV